MSERLGDQWIVVQGWETFQHYRDRNPVWIRLYTDLIDRPEWHDLSDAGRGLLVTIWLAFASSNGQVRVRDVSDRGQTRVRRRSLERLCDAGWIALSASRPLPQRQRQIQRQKNLYSSNRVGTREKLPLEIRGAELEHDLNGSEPIAEKLLRDVRDADGATRGYVDAFARMLPEAAFARAIEALHARRRQPGPPLVSEARYVVATLRDIASERASA